MRHHDRGSPVRQAAVEPVELRRAEARPPSVASRAVHVPRRALLTVEQVQAHAAVRHLVIRLGAEELAEERLAQRAIVALAAIAVHFVVVVAHQHVHGHLEGVEDLLRDGERAPVLAVPRDVVCVMGRMHDVAEDDHRVRQRHHRVDAIARCPKPRGREEDALVVGRRVLDCGRVLRTDHVRVGEDHHAGGSRRTIGGAAREREATERRERDE